MDSGASNDVTRNKEILDLMKVEKIDFVMAAGGEQYRVERHENAHVLANSYEIKLDNILYTQFMHKNLISVRKLVDKGHAILFAQRYC